MKQEPLTESYFYILLCLYRGPLHGYGIMQLAKELSDGNVIIGSGTMYGATGNMMKKNWIKEVALEDAEKGKRCYALTEEGRNILQSEINRLHYLVEVADTILVGKETENGR